MDSRTRARRAASVPVAVIKMTVETRTFGKSWPFSFRAFERRPPAFAGTPACATRPVGNIFAPRPVRVWPVRSAGGLCTPAFCPCDEGEVVADGSVLFGGFGRRRRFGRGAARRLGAARRSRDPRLADRAPRAGSLPRPPAPPPPTGSGARDPSASDEEKRRRMPPSTSRGRRGVLGAQLKREFAARARGGRERDARGLRNRACAALATPARAALAPAVAREGTREARTRAPNPKRRFVRPSGEVIATPRTRV